MEDIQKVEELLKLMTKYKVDALKIGEIEIHKPLLQEPVTEQVEEKSEEELEEELLFHSTEY